MSLSTALNIAQNSLLNTQRQISVVSRNIADAQNPDYARRTATLSSMSPGTRIAEIRRATNEALFKQNMYALSGYTAQKTITDGLDRLTMSVNGIDNATSTAAALGDFMQALQFYAATPSNRTLAETTIESARSLVRTLNQGTEAIQTFRTDMDSQIATAVGGLNALLAEFKGVNDEIINGTRAGRNVSDAFDKRDAILKKVSEYLPITTIERRDNDLMIVTADGATLFETIPRHVSFDQTAAFGAATVGDTITVDGVPVSNGVGGNTTASGTLAAMLQLRDTVSTGMQLQLDEMARAVNNAVPGLVTWTGALADPGIAGRITLNPLVDPSVGGDPTLLRDGILVDSNPDDSASFSDLLNGYIEAMDAPATFVTASGATATFSLMDYSADAISWLEANRKEAASGSETKNALMMRSAAALSNVTNVNVDEEMALLLELENSYAASARIIQTLDNMLATLLDAVR